MQYKILILEDDEYFALELKSILFNHYPNSQIDVYHNINHEINISLYDIFFLDVDLSGNDDKEGFCFAEEINIISDDKMIIFVTSHTDLWKEGYYYRPYWYIDKSHYKEELNELFHRRLDNDLKKKYAYIYIEYDNEVINILLKDIIYIENQRNHVNIYTLNRELKKYMPFKSVLKDIGDNIDLFIQINSGIIVSKKHINFLKNNDIVLDNGVILPVSRRHKKEVKSCVSRLKE